MLRNIYSVVITLIAIVLILTNSQNYNELSLKDNEIEFLENKIDSLNNQIVSTKNNPITFLNEAKTFLSNGSFESAVLKVEALINQYPESNEALLAVDLKRQILIAKELNDYDDVIKLNDRDSYLNFLISYPNSKFKSKIEQRIETLDFNIAKDYYTTEAFQEFINHYPNSSKLEEVYYYLTKIKEDKITNYSDYEYGDDAYTLTDTKNINVNLNSNSSSNINKYSLNSSPSYYQQENLKTRIGAICNDGTRSSATGRGACSHHGGVAYWLYK